MKKLFLTSQFSRVAEKLPWGLLENSKKIRVAFIVTAATLYSDPWWMEEDKNKLQELGFLLREIDVREKNEDELRDLCSDCQCIFVAGGNTFFLLYHVRKSGFDHLLKEMINRGVPYIGSSAGSVLVGPSLEPIRDIDDENESPPLDSYDALNIIDVIILPHHGAQFGATNDRIIKEFGDRYHLIPLADDQALLVEGDLQKTIDISS